VELPYFGFAVARDLEELLGMFDRLLLRRRLNDREAADQLGFIEPNLGFYCYNERVGLKSTTGETFLGDFSNGF
jgi:hypothetical protein